MQYLDLSGADLSKANDWLQVTFKHPSLLELRLSNCGLEDDPSPISVNSTKSLVILDLSGNGFSSVPKSIFSLHSLMSFDLIPDLTLNHLNSSIPNSLYSLNRLQFLSRSENQLQGTISRAIGNLSSITHLDLCSNFMLEGRLPTSLEYLCKLKEMDLSYKKIEDGISEILQSLSRCCLGSLESLDMADNELSGHLTDQLGQFKNLAYLSLARNKIFGPIQLSIGELSSLKFFDVSENQLNVLKGLEDEYSATLGLVTNMDLSTNSLTGEIPKEIGSLIELRSLNLSANLLAGNIPNEIDNMELMESLDLSMNRLNGEIPPSISNLNFLNHFNVSYNNLTGQIPISTQLQSFENFSYMGNHVCGPPLIKSCNTKGIPTDVANNGSSSEGSKVNWFYVA
ncbi:hypothetical protein Goklo_021636 [Gossypium klotzschianum]|uniref:Uncharacterized protein n=1 Tax=Gossypium klotzschianum TaxID=34286 RepID=A0A7J8UW22_9ROSI|nr:hypothetical protein [Gossypium klotzschianum]